MDRALLDQMFRQAVAQAQPALAIGRHLPEKPAGRTIVIGAGKASAQMARAFEQAWDGPVSGLVVTRYGYAEPCERIEIVEAAQKAHIGGAQADLLLRFAQGGGRQIGIPGVPLADVELGAKVKVLRFENEAEDLLHYLMDIGLHPGLEGTVTASDDESVLIESGERKHEVTRTVAETVTVRADPAPPPRAALPDQLVLSEDRYGR